MIKWLSDKGRHPPDTQNTFQVSLPPFRAALVPSWAMAPQSVPEAFSQDFLFPLGGSNSVSGNVSSFKSGAAPVKCCWLEAFSRVRSAAGVEWSALSPEETEKERTETPQAFQTIVIPRLDLGGGWPLARFPQSDYPTENTRNPLVLPGTRVGHSEFGFDKHAEEWSAVHTSVIL